MGIGGKKGAVKIFSINYPFEKVREEQNMKIVELLLLLLLTSCKPLYNEAANQNYLHIITMTNLKMIIAKLKPSIEVFVVFEKNASS